MAKNSQETAYYFFTLLQIILTMPNSNLMIAKPQSKYTVHQSATPLGTTMQVSHRC